MLKDRNKTVEVKLKEGDKEVTKKFIVKRPTSGALGAASRHRAKIWNECLIDGVLTKQELEDLMEKRGLWGKAQQDKYNQLVKDIQDLEKALYIGDGKKKHKLSEGKDKAIQIRTKRFELQKLIAQKIAMEENTAEALSENARFDFLVAECSYKEDGTTKVYNNVDDYNEQSADEVANALAAELASMMYSLDKEFEASLPENKWLLQHKLVNQDLSLVDKQGNLIDLEGRRIDEEGNYINEKGEKVDKDGNVLSDDGTYVPQVEYEDDINSSTKPKSRSSSKTVKADS